MSTSTWELLHTAQFRASTVALVLTLVLAIRYFQSQSPKRLNLPIAKIQGNDWKATVQKATAEFPDDPFILPAFPPRIILPNRVMDEIRKLPEEKLSVRKEIYYNMHGKYTDLGKDHPVGIAAIKTDLTNNIGRMLPELQDEAAFALKFQIGAAPEWKQVFLYEKFMALSALTNGRMFVGLPVSRNPEWIQMSIKYTVDTVEVIKAINSTKPFLRPFLASSLPAVKNLSQDKLRGAQILKPYIDAVLQARKRPDAAENPANNQYNLISWMLNQMDTERSVDFQLVANEQLFAGFGSIHNTCVMVANILFDLASHPQYIPELRQEIAEVLATEPDHVLRKVTLPKMRKLDSLLRESQRMSPASMTSIQRFVTAKEGIKLSTGHTIPHGASIGFMHPLAPFVKTPPNLKTPLDFVPTQPPLDEFYPFRSSEIRSIPGHENGYQFVQTGPDNINFGHGPMACPGRFFAGALVKVIIIEILRRYDIALGPNGEGEGGPNNLKRPANIVHANLQCMPDFAKPIYFKELPQVVPFKAN
ncbi:cytochrome P450 [Xylogone sp. PMI_703]|nr:cytochrome P450 [Xylogone sp. PMI_703]